MVITCRRWSAPGTGESHNARRRQLGLAFGIETKGVEHLGGVLTQDGGGDPTARRSGRQTDGEGHFGDLPQ